MALDQAILNEEEFSDKSLVALKENFTNTMISFCFCYIINQMTHTEKDRLDLQKSIINTWKNGIKETNQNAFKEINDKLKAINADFLNIISENSIPDIEDYQRISTKNVKEVEGIFWRICGEDDNGNEKVTRK